jgi:hypothetical protein
MSVLLKNMFTQEELMVSAAINKQHSFAKMGQQGHYMETHYYMPVLMTNSFS